MLAAGAAAIAAASATAGPAAAHHPGDSGVQPAGPPKTALFRSAALPPQLFPTDAEAQARVAAAPPGPCTAPAAQAFPDGDPHDHQKISDHRFRCRADQTEFFPLKEEATRHFGREDIVLGEMDVKGDIAAVAVTFPAAGILFYDVKDPAKPKFLSVYRGGECDAQPIDINCGAFVDLSHDAKVAYLAVQNLSSVPDVNPALLGGRPGTAGVEMISLANPRSPQLVQIYTVTAGVTGTHTSRSHVIPGAPPSGPNGPRAPGEYLFSNQNSVGVNIARVERIGGIPQVTFVNTIDAPDLHDTFIHNDPIDNRTYLYLADGFGEDSDGTQGTAFVVYDVTDPSQPRRLAQWDLTPECERDWYTHTIDTTVQNRHRYVTLDAELFDNGDQSNADDEAGCGRPRAEGRRAVQGNANVAGPLWIVDATDFKSLAQASDNSRTIKTKSQRALVATWENPAGRAGGNLTFSPHNQQIVGDKIYLSHYHGGVFVLDASSAFDGKKESPAQERPRELTHLVPSGEPMRPDVNLATDPLRPFFTGFPLGHPEIWDMVFYRGSIVVADMTGGFYSFKENNDRPPPAPPIQPPVQPPGGILGDRFLISGRPIRVGRNRVARIRVFCRSTRPCRGRMQLRTRRKSLLTRDGRRVVRQVTLAVRRFAVRPSRRGTVLSFRIGRGKLRYFSRGRRPTVQAAARVRFDRTGLSVRVFQSIPASVARGR